MTLNIKQKFLFHIISFISIRNKATNRFSIWKKISPQDSISLLEHGRTDAVWHLSRSFHALEHTEWTSLICIILTTSVAGRPVFRETRASSVHNSTNIGNCLANWNSSPPPVSPLAVTIRARRRVVVVVFSFGRNSTFEIVSRRIIVVDIFVVELKGFRNGIRVNPVAYVIRKN